MIRKYDLDLYPMSLYIGTISDFYNSKRSSSSMELYKIC